MIGPLDATVTVPGSKSITNRALVCAALAEGRSTLTGALASDDTDAMIGCLRALGVAIEHDPLASTMTVEGSGGRLLAQGAALDVGLSGTTARFIAPVAALGRGLIVIDGGEPIRRRPMGGTVAALRDLGVAVETGTTLPLSFTARGLQGGPVSVSGDLSSQFLSGLLLAAPASAEGMTIDVVGEVVSKPYIDLTLAVMEAFGASIDRNGYRRFHVPPHHYVGRNYAVEPDASAASYFFAAAAICGGRVRVKHLGRFTHQGDLRFVDVLAKMGCDVERADDWTEVRRSGPLVGVDVDMGDISDTVPTLASVAVFAEGPTRIRGVGFIRGKETDRIAAVVTELRRCGIEAEECSDGFVVHPGSPNPADVRTYDDHRMAMSFALLGLRATGITILDPGCVAKTFPGYWDALDTLKAEAR